MKVMGKQVVTVTVLLIFGLTYGCTTQVTQVKRKPIYEEAKSLIAIPKKLEKKKYPKGTIVSLEKDQQAPFPGALFIEERAKLVGQLRLEYDHLYSVANANHRFTMVLLKTADKQLADADKTIKRLRDRQNTWWAKNKLWVAISVTFVLSLGLMGVTLWGVGQLRE